MSRVFLRSLPHVLIVTGLCGWLGCNSFAPPEPPPNPDDPAGQSFDDRIGSGTARVTGTVRSADLDEPLPLGGVRLTLGDASAVSNIDGTFLLLGVEGGVKKLVVDASELRAGDGRFGRFVGSLDVASGSDLFIERPIYISFVPDSASRPVRPFEKSEVSAEGVSLSIPPGGAREDDVEFNGGMSIGLLHATRTPLALPSRFDENAIEVVDIQPAGVTFPVPATIRFPLRSGEPGGAFKLLWSWDTASGMLQRVALMERAGNRWVVAEGGVRQSGVHVLADYEWSLIEPCDDQSASAARMCLGAWSDVQRELRRIGPPRLPGARTVFDSLHAAMATRNGTDERASDILLASADLFVIARESVAAYQLLFRELEDLTVLDNLFIQADGVCAEVTSCSDVAGQTEVERNALAALIEWVHEHAFRFDRLRAAVESLAPFYELTEPLAEPTRIAFEAVAEEFNRAHEDFAPLESPIDAYDTIVDLRDRVARFVRGRIASLSVPAGSGASDADDALVRLMRFCPGSGVTASVAVTDSAGVVDWSVSSAGPGPEGEDECKIIAIDEFRGLTSLPVPEIAAVRDAGAFATAALDRTIRFFDTRLQRIESEVLTADSPVHVWRFDGPQRAGVAVSFDARGDALAGIAAGDGIVRVARRGGFSALNLPGGESMGLYVWGGGLESGGDVPYDFSMSATPELFDFGAPVSGTFDVFHRVEAILIDVPLARRVLIERTCCESFSAAWSFTLRGPSGAAIPPADFRDAPPRRGSEAFDLIEPGRYSLSIVPEAGSFGDYAVVIHDVPVNAPIDYTPGTVADAVLNDRGERLVYRFAGREGEVATLEGLSSVELGPLLVTMTTADGEVVLQETLLFFDGSSFSSRIMVLPRAGDYLLSFRAPLDAGPMTGTFRFILTTEDAAPSPEPESDPN